MRSFASQLPQQIRPAYHWDVRYTILESVFLCICYEMLSFVSRKTIGITEFQLAVISIFAFVGPLLCFILPHLFRSKSNIQFILWVSVPCKLLFIALAWIYDPFLFCCVASAGLFFMFLQVPMYAALLKSLYPDTLRGTIQGHIRFVSLIVTVAVTYLTGKWLNMNGQNFRVVFVLASLAGLLGAFFLSRIQEKTPALSVQTRSIAPLSRIVQVLRSDRVFIQYQVAFFLGGFANLAGIPIYVLYVVDVIQADYFQIALAAGVIHNLAGALTLRGWGRWLDRNPDPIWQRLVIQTLWIVHPLCFVLAWDMTLIYVAWGLLGILYAGGKINFMLGSLYFSKTDEDATVYTIIHQVNWGLRGILAPMFGYGIYRWLGFIYAFYIFAGIMVVASAMTAYLYGKYSKRG